jgi:hypothetical protein
MISSMPPLKVSHSRRGSDEEITRHSPSTQRRAAIAAAGSASRRDPRSARATTRRRPSAPAGTPSAAAPVGDVSAADASRAGNRRAKSHRRDLAATGPQVGRWRPAASSQMGGVIVGPSRERQSWVCYGVGRPVTPEGVSEAHGRDGLLRDLAGLRGTGTLGGSRFPYNGRECQSRWIGQY